MRSFHQFYYGKLEFFIGLSRWWWWLVVYRRGWGRKEWVSFFYCFTHYMCNLCILNMNEREFTIKENYNFCVRCKFRYCCNTFHSHQKLFAFTLMNWFRKNTHCISDFFCISRSILNWTVKATLHQRVCGKPWYNSGCIKRLFFFCFCFWQTICTQIAKFRCHWCKFHWANL